MNPQFVVGVDEAGRGPLAGPLAVGAIRVQEDVDLLALFPGLNDSKKISEKKREALFARLQEEHRNGVVEWTVALMSAKTIDAHGMSAVLRGAVAQTVSKLLPNPEEGNVQLDGSLAAPPVYRQETIVGGDAVVPAIMLASVVAKVVRDRRMLELDEKYPEYGFGAHKGYGTKAHFAAILEHGACVEHRQLFLRKFNRTACEPVNTN